MTLGSKEIGITYKVLRMNDIDRISDIDASCHIKYAWRMVDGQRVKILLDYYETGFPEGIEHHKQALKNTIKHHGFAIGAFNEEEKLIGFLTLNNHIFGNTTKYVLLDQLFISKPYRGLGIGKKLFYQSIEKARSFGASKIYVCAGSSADTIAFYRRLGCKDAFEINQALLDDDPIDVHLEFEL